MTMETDIFEQFTQIRGVGESTVTVYKSRLKKYCEFNEMTLGELLEEAEEEEEAKIRWKHRILKTRLLDYRHHLQENYTNTTLSSYFTTVLEFYETFEIELHKLPELNKKNLKTSPPIKFSDLPTEKIIKAALKIATPLYRAMILFMSSSGTARAETLSITVQNFIDATYGWHGKDNIDEALEILYSKDNVVPIFHLKRIKTDKYYYTCCSPEAVSEIVMYLSTSRKNLKPTDKIFNTNAQYVLDTFKEINDMLGLGKVGPYSRFRTHMLRKFNASKLYNDGMSMDFVDALQGRMKNGSRKSYFIENPDKLREIYIKHMNAVTINLDVNTLDLKSPEYGELETELQNERRTNEENTKRIDRLESALEKSNLLNKIQK